MYKRQGFTLPSVLLMVAFALGVAQLGDISEAGWLLGLKAAAVAVVAQAVYGMTKNLVTGKIHAAIAVAAAAWLSTPWALLGLVFVPLLLPSTRIVLRGGVGPELIAVLKATGMAELACAAGLFIGFLLG